MQCWGGGGVSVGLVGFNHEYRRGRGGGGGRDWGFDVKGLDGPVAAPGDESEGTPRLDGEARAYAEAVVVDGEGEGDGCRFGRRSNFHQKNSLTAAPVAVKLFKSRGGAVPCWFLI
jgi:hypothetical protein